MAATNEWAMFGLEDPQRPKRQRRLFKNIDTSRMSWMDCHAGFMIVSFACYLISPVFNLAFLVGMIAGLNGGYAIAFTQRPPGYCSSPIWWLALFTSVLVFTGFGTLEVMLGLERGVGLADLIVIAIVTKLSLGQLLFLYRIRRERPVQSEVVDGNFTQRNCI
jgi:hypothetical protein